jgi:hypothetical protein
MREYNRFEIIYERWASPVTLGCGPSTFLPIHGKIVLLWLVVLQIAPILIVVASSHSASKSSLKQSFCLAT